MDKHAERQRIKQIISVFLKHGIREGIRNINNPVQIRKALEELGPTFIKIGQILSTRPDMLPEPYICEFQKLQDNVKSEPSEEIIKIIERELKGTIDHLFLSFDPVPVACASLAQVHRARLKGGEQVVVKVQRPGARETITSDIAILKRLVLFMRFTPPGSIVNPSEVVDELSQAVAKELDFLQEAGNIKRFSENNKDVKFITAPKVYDNYTTSNILVMEYIDGIKIARLDMLNKENYDLEDMAVKLANNYLKQVFEDGFFHGDPHPGNILIQGTKIAYIDFGQMGVLSKSMQKKFNEFMYGIGTRNVDIMTQVILRIGVMKGQVDLRKVRTDVEHIYNNYIETSLNDLQLTQMMDEIFKVLHRNNITMPRDITMLFKGVVTIEGVVARLAPDINVMDVAVPYIRGQMIKKRDYKEDMLEQIDNLYNLTKYGLKIPNKLLELINSTLAGNLKVQMEHTNYEKLIYELSRMTNRIVFGLIVSALIIGSSQVMNTSVGPRTFNMPALGFIGYISAAVLGFWLIISILRSGRM